MRPDQPIRPGHTHSAAAPAHPAADAAGSPRAARPNVLWVCADDFAPYVCGAYGNRQVRTPNLDRLAAAGLRFDRAFCSCPLSTPSRQAFWTGRYPRSIGVTLSPTPLPEDEVTLPALLRRAGYLTAAFGKTHYYAPRKHEFDRGADHTEFREWLAARAPGPLPPGAEVLGPWRPFWDPAAVWLNGSCLPQPARAGDMADTFFADQAVDFLSGRHAAPFFLYVSLFATHAPFHFPVEFRGRHRPEAFAVPPVRPGQRDRLPSVFRDLTDSHKQGILAAYHTAAEFLDWNVGRVLEALAQSAYADDTLVLFTSDHGYLLGQHGRFEKHCCYEPAIRSALLLRAPGLTRPGQTTDALVELIDLVPTVLEYCGEAPPAGLHGRSLLPLVRGETAVHREHVLVEYADNAEAAVRTARWKLIYGSGRRRRGDGYATGAVPPLAEVLGGQGPPTWSMELYDLADDPEEAVNLAGRPEHAAVREELLARQVAHVRATARFPDRLPPTDDVHVLLAYGLVPVEDSFPDLP
jgi:choline-sulfatase